MGAARLTAALLLLAAAGPIQVDGDDWIELFNIEYGSLTFGGGVVSGHRPAAKPDGEPLTDGFIALQSESHPVQFRRIALLNLKGCMNPAAANYRAYFVEADPGACE